MNSTRSRWATIGGGLVAGVATLAGTTGIILGTAPAAHADISSFDHSVTIATDALQVGVTYQVTELTAMDSCTATLYYIDSGRRVFIDSGAGSGALGSATATLHWTPQTAGSVQLISSVRCPNGYYTDQGNMTVTVAPAWTPPPTTTTVPPTTTTTVPPTTTTTVPPTTTTTAPPTTTTTTTAPPTTTKQCSPWDRSCGQTTTSAPTTTPQCGPWQWNCAPETTTAPPVTTTTVPPTTTTTAPPTTTTAPPTTTTPPKCSRWKFWC